MNIDFEEREKQLKSLNEFITNTRKKIFDITKEFQWDITTLKEQKEMVRCPFDDGHVVPKSSLQNHVERCKFKRQEYHPEDVPFPPLAVDCNTSSVLKVDTELQSSILREAKRKNPSMLIGFPGAVDDRDIPLTSDRFMSSLTSDEKAAIHSYVVSNTVSPGEGKDISLLEQDLEKNFKNKKEEKRDKTPLEKLIEERDAKRRKEGKKVHINRKSHSEIIREVIENQMEVYVEWLKDKNIIESEEVETAQLVASDNQSEGEIIEADVKQEYDAGSGISGSITSLDKDERKQKDWEPGDKQRSYQRRNVNEYSDNWKQNDSQKYRESQYRSHHSRDSRNKKYRDHERTYRESERRNYKDYDYKKFSGKYSADEKDDYGKFQASKHSSEKYWDGGAHVVKEYRSSDEEIERKSKTRKSHRKKQEKEKKHHRSKKRHHSSDSESDSRTKYKKEKDYRRNN